MTATATAIEPLSCEELITFVEENFSTQVKEKLVSNWNSLSEEFRDNNSLSLNSIAGIIGNPPRILDSPDMDCMLEAYEERAKYGHMCLVLDSIMSILAELPVY